MGGIAGLETARELLNALGRRAVGPALGADLALDKLLNPIITHRGGGVDRFLDLVGKEYTFIAK